MLQLQPHPKAGRTDILGCRGRSRCFRVLFGLIMILTFAFDRTPRAVVAGGAPTDLIFFSDSGTCLRSTTKVSLLISLTGSPAKISRPSFALPGRTAEVTGLSTTPSTFFCSTTLGARPSPPTGPVDFWGVAAPRLSCWEYWDEKSQFGHTFKCDESTTIIIEIIAKGMREHWNQSAEKTRHTEIPSLQSLDLHAPRICPGSSRRLEL